MNIDFAFNFKHFASLLDKGRQHRCAGDPEVKESAVSHYNTKSKGLELADLHSSSALTMEVSHNVQ